MEVVIRPVTYGRYEPVVTDAVSCTYDMDGFTLMSAVLSQLGLDREHFRRCAHIHEGQKFRVISHGDEKPFVITTTKTERWDSLPCAIDQILNAAEAERCHSLCMTQFAHILGEFPWEAFAESLRKIEQGRNHTQLKRVVVDVDDRYVEVAKTVHQQVQAELTEAE